jgi:predicted RNase H-like HicB family nuclease
MNKYSYPAIFTPEENGAYSVFFPDFENCYTCGDNLADSIYMAEDVLAFTIYDLQKDGKTLPIPSELSSVKTLGNEFVNYIACDTLEYLKRNSSKSVKKTLTIPEWLNETATQMNINFSQVLQAALLTIVQK